MENKAKSHIQARVEYVFGVMTNTMKEITIRSIWMAHEGTHLNGIQYEGLA
jgi:hypothetical protein